MRANLSDLFLLCEAFSHHAVRANFTCDTTDVKIWRCGGTTGNITLKQNQGRYFRDLVGTTSVGIDLVSDRVQSAFRDADITGWRPHPITFVDRKGAAIQGYDALTITGRCGPLDDSRCIKGTRLFPGAIKPSVCYFGFYFDEDSWDGTDIFTPQGSLATLVSRRVIEVLADIKATNIHLQPILEVDVDPIFVER